MKTNYLFPHVYKKIGWFLLIPTLIVGLVFFGQEPDFLDFKVFSVFGSGMILDGSGGHGIFQIIRDNILNEIIGIVLIISSLFVAFSKEKEEDEFITHLRLKSLTRAVFINYGLLLLSFFTLYGLNFAWLAIFNIFTFLLVFIAIFQINLWKSKKSLSYEE
jgi:uncharacterized membrane protein YfcA